MLKLYDYFRSSASFRVRIALNIKGLDYECIPVHLTNSGGEQNEESYSNINPHRLVPSLIDGSKILTQSLAIIEYLDETHPTPAIFPTNNYKKALVKAFALSIVADLHPLNNLRVLNYLKNDLQVSDDQKAIWYKHWVKLTFDALEAQLVSQASSNKYCFGDVPSLADICLVPQMYNARRFNCDLSSYHTLVRIDETCQQLEPFAKAWPTEPVT